MYKEPKGQELAGHLHYKVVPSAYEAFMDEQNIPIYKDRGVYDIRQLPLAPWKRMGGQGTFIQLDGQAGLWGMYVVEIPAEGVLNTERHLYEELFLVFDGRGSTEVWREKSAKRQIFEWQPGSHFAVPLNTSHRLVNAASSPALLLVTTSAPRAMNLYPSRSFIFENPYEFEDRYDESEDYFKPRDELEPHPVTGRAMLRSNIIPDIVQCYLPLDNTRGPGFRYIAPQMAGNAFFAGFIAEYDSGRYSKAHHHQSGAVLVCLKGKGYSYNWPRDIGNRPWEAGKGDLVERQDYGPGGMVSAAPGGGEWFHQHFSIGKDRMRFRTFDSGGWMRPPGAQAGQKIPGVRAEISEGGYALSYRDEDPHVRKTYQEALKKEGVEFQMPDSLYE